MADDKASKSGTRLAVGWPQDRFEHGVSGVPALTTEFSEPLAEAKVKEIRRVARENDVPLRQKTSDDGDEEAGS
jgi:hypothetical protein